MGIAAMVFTAACKKTENETEGPVICLENNILLGYWELREEQSSMLPVQKYVAGNGNKVNFTNQAYAFSAKGQVTQSGPYTVVNDTAVSASTCLNLPPNQFYRIVFDSNYTATKTYISVMGNKLRLVSGCFALDAGSLRTYEKVMP